MRVQQPLNLSEGDGRARDTSCFWCSFLLYTVLYPIDSHHILQWVSDDNLINGRKRIIPSVGIQVGAYNKHEVGGLVSKITCSLVLDASWHWPHVQPRPIHLLHGFDVLIVGDNAWIPKKWNRSPPNPSSTGETKLSVSLHWTSTKSDMISRRLREARGQDSAHCPQGPRCLPGQFTYADLEAALLWKDT